MSLIIDFYKGLDVLNLIIFWGVIIVIILLLIFSIIISNKNKKLKNIIKKSNDNQKEKFDDIPLLTKEENNIKGSTNIIQGKLDEKMQNPITQSNNQEIEVEKEIKESTDSKIKPENKTMEIVEEKSFIAEEHVMEYNQDIFALPNIKKTSENLETTTNQEIKSQKAEIKIPTGPYQRNVLREMSLNQTSPIGIVKSPQKSEKEISHAKELQTILSEDNQNELNQNQSITKSISESKSVKQENSENQTTNLTYQKTISESESFAKEKTINNQNINVPESNLDSKKHYVTNHQSTSTQAFSPKMDKSIETKLQTPTKIIEPKSNSYPNISQSYEESLLNYQPPAQEKIEHSKTSSSQANYLEEVSKILANAEQIDSVNRTEYELQQEEDAIISYEELMQKKDSIKMVDEEEAVISIEELMNKKSSKEKLYKLTEEEENDMFIKELKDFRNDL